MGTSLQASDYKVTGSLTSPDNDGVAWTEATNTVLTSLSIAFEAGPPPPVLSPPSPAHALFIVWDTRHRSGTGPPVRMTGLPIVVDFDVAANQHMVRSLQNWLLEVRELISWGDTKNYTISFTLSDTEVVPEPATIALFGIGIAGLAGAEVRRRRKKKAVDNS